MTLALIHGFAGGTASFGAIRRTGRHALWLAGHGRRPIAVSSFESEVDRLAKELEPLAPVGLLGYSLGGRLCLGLLQRHSALVTHAVVVGAHPGLEDADRPARAAWERGWADLLREQGMNAFVREWEKLPVFESQIALPNAEKESQREIRLDHEPAALASAMVGLGLSNMPDYRGLIQDSPRPLKWVVGELDAKFRSLFDAEEIAAVVVPGAGHNVLLENPSAIEELLEPVR